VQQKIETGYIKYVDEHGETDFSDYAFMLFLDFVLYMSYAAFIIFGTVSLYFFTTREVLPLLGYTP
tara:strand:+ start:240 stop:437 length:198 start_codon:yes stop_codon:yes gene_type:complete